MAEQTQTSGLDTFNRLLSGGILLIVVGVGAYWTNSNWDQIVAEHDSFRDRVNLPNHFENGGMPFRPGRSGIANPHRPVELSETQLNNLTNFRPDFDPTRSIDQQLHLSRDHR